MTLPSPSISDSEIHEVTLSAELIGRELLQSRLFSIEGLELHLLPGERFAPVADAVGLLREATYRQQLSGSGDRRDLDGRDSAYDHLLLIEPGSGALAGAARLQFLPGQCGTSDLPDGSQSYLEHVYPGIKARLTSLGNHLEIGRVALASRFQKQPHSLMALFRGGLLIASRSGYDTLHGLVSYNHFAHSEPVNQAFLSGLMRPPYLQSEPTLPAPRHPLTTVQTSDQTNPIANIQSLELSIREQLSNDFRLPVLLRQYVNLMDARVCGLSLAKDFNQITEILMAADLSRIPLERLNYFIDVPHEPIYQHFSWYRGG